MLIEKLLELLKEKNITQLLIENKTGIDQGKLSLTFNGKRKLTADELMKIAISFDINLNEIKKELSIACKQNT